MTSLLGTFILHGCMTFRVSEKKMRQFFLDRKLQADVKHFKAGKYRMEYAHAGDSTKPMVLFVHGSPGSLSAFLGYLADSTLKEHAFTITADRPGFGHSNFGVAEPSLYRQSQILKTIIERHAQARPVILVGHSLGGPIIARMAIDYPDLVDALVIIAGSFDPDLEPNETWFRAPLSTPFLRWTLPRSLRASNDELYKLKPQLVDMSDEWSGINCPVVVIHGKKDSLVPFGNVEFLRHRLVNATAHYLIHEDAGHFIPWQHHDLVVKGIMTALEETKTRKLVNDL